MNMAAPPPADPSHVSLSKAQALLRGAASGLARVADELVPLRAALETALETGDAASQKMATRLMAKLDALEPSVTMIGQIKSGKTSLVNCMIGAPDLLPTDVNPWTSVVTSLHMNPVPSTPDTSASFCFFEENEWDRLIAGGGRIGELANRAGADEELSKIKLQVEMMREKSRARLGEKFELLLGQQHEYRYFDHELIERYVCLGDEFDDSTSDAQGRFADITRSADLRFHQPAIPLKLCIRDTPGVNDTFMMREQITIRSIRDSRICVVVLSAHQALSSTDLALVRMISNMKSNDVIIFVNRIDELSDPVAQIPQIEKSIRETLLNHEGPDAAETIFGSALWAQGAMLGSFANVSDASKAALMNLARASQDPEIKNKTARAVLWEFSGLPALFDAISERIAEGEAHETRQQVLASTRNLIAGIRQADNLASKADIGDTVVRLSVSEIDTALTDLRHSTLARLDADLEGARSDFAARLDRVHDSFLGRATEALLEHLDDNGADAVWEYDPSGLRLLLRSSYQSFGKASQSAFSRCVASATEDYLAIYTAALDLPRELFDIKAPPVMRVPPPVALGQTIALDLKGNWWKSWWFKRRGFQAYADDFQKLIHAETISFITDLKGQHVVDFHEALRAEVERFLTEQSEVLSTMANAPMLKSEQIDRLFDRQTLIAREALLGKAQRTLDSYAS